MRRTVATRILTATLTAIATQTPGETDDDAGLQRIRGTHRQPGRPLQQRSARLRHGRGEQAFRLRACRAFPCPPRRQQAVVASEHRGLCQHARRDDRQPGDAAGPRGPEGDLPVRLAGCRRREHSRFDVSGPVDLPGQFRTGACQADQQDPASRRPDRNGRGRRAEA